MCFVQQFFVILLLLSKFKSDWFEQYPARNFHPYRSVLNGFRQYQTVDEQQRPFVFNPPPNFRRSILGDQASYPAPMENKPLSGRSVESLNSVVTNDVPKLVALKGNTHNRLDPMVTRRNRHWWLDNLIKLLYSHPTQSTTVKSHEPLNQPNRIYAHFSNIMRRKPESNNVAPFMSQENDHIRDHLSPHAIDLEQYNWPTSHYDSDAQSRELLQRKLSKYQQLMLHRQWKQFLLTSIPGSQILLFNLPLFEAAVTGVRRAVAECRYQFRHERWNCSQVANDESSLFGNILLKGIPQTAFVYSIINAGIVQAVAEACLGLIDNCPCDNRGRQSPGLHWQWQGCDHNVHFGRKFSRRLLDSMERGKHIRHQMNLHNNRVGRLIVTSNMEKYCRCHGTSGSCTMRTCYRRTPRMRQVSNLLKQLYEKNMVQVNSIPNSDKYRSSRGLSGTTNNLDRKANRRYAQRPQLVVVQDGTSTRIEERFYRRSTPQNQTNPRPNQLVYYESPPKRLFCSPQPHLHISGTHGRLCNSSSTREDSCDQLCCDRGYLVHHYYAMDSCHCKFIWCCRVECQQCLVLKRLEICN